MDLLFFIVQRYRINLLPCKGRDLSRTKKEQTKILEIHVSSLIRLRVDLGQLKHCIFLLL